ncbi:MAG: hypothetical protein IIZ30_15080 [Sphingomonas sp.]|uniref:hypothetical protein n=1 Tax=Sphingomonas sp. TaxID=28214 RepID=UPI00257AF057|nr:hypothetical protein [Sphingomonas sp.]MBQ1481346.1 hypothetical protein [Sphingomonas sp.]
MGKVIGTVGVIVGAVALAATGIGAIAAPGLAGAISIGGIKASTLLLAGTALQAAGRALTKQPKASSTTTDRLTANLVTDTPRKMAFGRTALNTDLRYQEWWGNEQEYCSQVFALASHHCESVDEIWLDDKLAWTAAGGVQGEFAGYLVVAHFAQAGPGSIYRAGWSNRWGGNATFSGCATLYLQFKVTGNGKKGKSPFTTSITNRVTVVGKGARLPDPRFDSTAGGAGNLRVSDQATWAWAPEGHEAGRNPALALLFYLIGWRIQNPITGEWRLAVGRGVPVDRIDLDSFMTAANLCDELVTKAGGGTEPRYRCDGTFSEGDDPSQVIAAFETCMNAKLRDSGGRFALQVLHNDLGTPVVDFTDDDVLGEFTWTAGNDLNDQRNVVRGRYTNPSALYQLTDFPAVRLAPVDGIDRIDAIDLALVQSPSQAQRLAKQRLQRQQYQGAFGAQFNARGWAVKDGDIVRLTFSALGWEKKLFRVSEGVIDPTGVVPLVLVEENAQIYAWDRDEVPSVQAAEPNTFNPLMLPIIAAIDEAGATAEWPAITGEGKPDDYATNSGDPNSPFGPGGTVKDALAQFERIDPIEAKVDAQALVAEAQERALATLTGTTNEGFEALDRAGVSRDQALVEIDRQLNTVAKSLIAQLIDLDTVRGIIRDAGITVDAENGQVRFWAIENLQNDQRNLEITLDAQKGEIRSRVTVAQVEEMITLAAFDPSQIADLTSFFARINNVEVVQNGILGTLKEKAEAIELTKQALKVTTLSNELDALAGVVETKASLIVVADQEIRLSDLIQRFEATPDGSRMSIELRQVRAATDATQLDVLRGILAGDEAEARRVAEIAQYSQDATVKITDGLAAQSLATRTLSVAMGDMDARQTERVNTLVTTTAAQADRLDALQVSNGKHTAQIASLEKASIDATGGIAGVTTTVRQMLPVQNAAGVALLDQVLSGDEAAAKVTAQLAQAQVDMTTRFVEGQLSQARLQQLLETRIAGNAALIGQTMQAQALINESTASRIDAINVSFRSLSEDLGTAVGDIHDLSLTTATLTRELAGVANAQEATAKDLSTLSAEMRNADTGLTATRALALRIEQASASASSANLKRIEAAEALLADPATGLAAVNAALAREVDLSARERAAQARALESLTAQVIDPATNRPVWEGSIGELRRIVLDGDQKLAEDVKTVSTTVDGHTSTISFIMRSIDGDDAVAQLSIDAGGKITGFRVNGKESLFAIAADRFIIGDSQIFEVDTVSGKVRMNDVEVNRIAAGVVDTDTIVGNAVSETTAVDFTDNSANGALNNYVTIATMTVKTVKATDRILLMLSGVLNANVEATSGTVTNTRLSLRLMRSDGTTIRAPYTALQEDNSGAYGAVTLIDLDVPGAAGTYTYQLQGSVAKSGGSGTQGATIRAIDGTFVATILKR